MDHVRLEARRRREAALGPREAGDGPAASGPFACARKDVAPARPLRDAPAVPRTKLGLLLLGGSSAGLCLAAGLSYLPGPVCRPEPCPPAGAFIATLGALGAGSLLTAGAWQLRAGGSARRIPLVILAALAAGYVAANSFALVLAEPLRRAFPGFSGAFHGAGLAAGAALFALSCAEIVVGEVPAAR